MKSCYLVLGWTIWKSHCDKNWHKLEVFCLFKSYEVASDFFSVRTSKFNLACNITNISTHNRIPNIQRKVVQFWGEKETIACNFRLGPLLQKYTISSKLFWICIWTHIIFMISNYLFLSNYIVEAVWCSNYRWRWHNKALYPSIASST